MTQEIRNDLRQCIQAEVKEIFQHISHLIQQAHMGEKTIDYVALDQKVSDHFNRFAYILRSICENSQLKKNETNALKKCFDYANTDLAQAYEQWKQQYPHEAQWYEIKLPHFKLAQPLARDNVIRQQQLTTGSLLLSFKKRFNAAWGEGIQLYLSNISQTSTSQEQQEAINCLFECLCINLILEQGCIQSERLLAIHDAIFEYDVESGLFPLYATKNDAAYVFCYEMKSKKYGNDYQLDLEGHPTLIQTQQIYFNPIAMICYLRIKEMLNGVHGYALQATSPMQIWQCTFHQKVEREDVLFKRLFTHIQQVLPQDSFLTELKRLGFSAFKPIDYVLWQSTSLDVLSTELIKDQLMTLPLRYSDQRLIFEEIPKQTDQIIQHRIAQKQMTVFPLDHHKTENKFLSEALDKPLGLDQTKVWKISFKQHKNARQLNDDLQDSISRSTQYITRYQQGEGGEYLDYILAVMNLRLCQWLHHLFRYRSVNGKTDLASSTIEKYYYTVSSDLLLYVLEHEMDLNTATATQFEEMYQTLFEMKYLEDREKQKKVASSQQKKQHKTAQVMLGRLKSFHHYLMVNHQVPSVAYFYQQQTGQGLFLKTNLVSPEMFQQMMFALNEFAPHWRLSVQDQMHLKWVYYLAYRLGLRIDEVIGIRLNDLVSAQLRCHPHNKGIYVEGQLTDLSLLIRANYHRNLKNANATRQFDLRYFLPKNEFVAFLHFYQQQIANGYAEASYKKQHRLLFSLNQSPLSANHLSKMTKSLFDVVLGTVEHRYTFHSLRHSAASHFALILRASVVLLRRYFGQEYLAYCFELRMHILPKTKPLKDPRAGCADLWQRLAYLMGHDSIRMTASHYIHVFQWLVADQFYQTDQSYDSSLVKALLQNSHIIKARDRFRTNDPNNTLCAFLKTDLEQVKRKALPKEIQKRIDHRPISTLLYQQRLLSAYQDWTGLQEENADIQAIMGFLTALTQHHFIYKKDRLLTRTDIENTWLRFIEWSYQYKILKPIEINENIKMTEIIRYLAILEHNISLDRDKPLIRFKINDQKDVLDYHFFIDFIQKIYPHIFNVVYIKAPILTHDQVKKGKNRARNYAICHKKAPNKHHFIQELLVNSLFLKLEMCDFNLKRAKTNPNQ